MNTQSPLLTDFYQFTMAYGYWQLGRAEQEAVFQLTFRKNPFKNNYTIACGLAAVIEFLKNYQFKKEDIEYLRSLTSSANTPTFSEEFLQYLQQLKFTCDIDAIVEGNIIFSQEPFLRIKGPLLQCQLLETPLLNMLNFSSLVATRSSQICQITGNNSVIEFGLRRAQGPNGAMTATRAAYVGGCESTSNVLAGKEFGIPVKGTMAHSWVMSYADELSAFQDFVKTIDITVLLVDTYNSIQGIKNAILVGKQLRKQNRDLAAIRLDSGDLLKLSRKARKMLDDAGFTKTKILASGDLTVSKIKNLKTNKAPIDIWGVGTKLVTAYEQPSLDAIYKLTALRENNKWQYKMKLSDSKEKTTYPGIHQVRRYFYKEKFIADVIYDTELGIDKNLKIKADHHEDLLQPIFRQGKLIYQLPKITDTRNYCLKQIAFFNKSNYKKYPVAFDPKIKGIVRRLKK